MFTQLNVRCLKGLLPHFVSVGVERRAHFYLATERTNLAQPQQGLVSQQVMRLDPSTL